MKVNVDKTLEVTDEQRKAIAATIDDAGSRPRDATRDEMKDFIWLHGARWAAVLAGESVEGDDSYEDDSDDLEDLI